MEAKYYGMMVHIWNFDKDIKIERKNFYMPSGKLIGSTAHVEVIKKTTTNSRLVIDGKLLYV